MQNSLLKIFFVYACFISFTSYCQPTTARVEVMVSNSGNIPLKGASVLFISSTDKKQIAGMTNEAGKFSLSLPAGFSYLIKMKTMNDTSNYSTLTIPALQPGQSFTAPFTVSIQYDPPRLFTLRNVHFDTGRPTLRSDSFTELDGISEYMKLKPAERYEISGHTDTDGKDEDNLKLSQQRAESVRNYLVKKGIASNRIIAKGYGSSKPVADNTTTDGRQQNRRTEVVIL